MHAHDALGPRHAGGDFGDRDRRGVCCEDRLGAENFFQRGEKLALGVELFDHRLDHQIGPSQGFERGRGLDQGGQIFALALGDFLALDQAREPAAHHVHALIDRAGRHVVEQHRVPGLHRHLGDAGPHGAGADNGNRGGTR